MYTQIQRRKRRKLNPYTIKFFVVALAAVIVIVGAAVLLFSGGNGGAGTDGDVQVPEWVTQEYLTINEFSRPGIPLEKVNGIVVHYIGNPGTTAEQNRSYFNNLAKTGETSASSHFIVGLNGEIIQCVPLNEIAYCSNTRNDDTISIECCHPDESGQFTEETYQSLVKLVAWLCSEYNLGGEEVIRHYDITGKECPRYFVENEEAWIQFKDDVNQAA